MKKALWCGLLALSPAFLSASLTSEPVDEAIARVEAAVKNKKADKPLVLELIDALRDPVASIRIKERSAWALGALEIRDAGPALIEAAQNKGLLVRSAALNALMRMRAKSALPTFIRIADGDPILSIRQNAVIALGLLQSEKAIQPLVKLSSDATPEVRGAAALAMGALQSKKNDFSQALAEMQADENPYVQERAKRALEAARRKTAAMLEQLNAPDSDVRLFAALYFHHHGTVKELNELKDAWNGEAEEETRFELSQAVIAVKKRAARKASPAKTKPKQKS